MNPETPLRDENAVDTALLDWITCRDRGETARVDDYLNRLRTEQQRREFRGLVDALDEITHSLPPRLEPNATFAGRYLLREEVGAGGMGRVFLAQDTKLGREVAIKILHVDAGGADAQALLARECQALVRLRHPNIVTIHDADQWGGTLYLVMEFVRGRTLEDVLVELRCQVARAPAERLDGRALEAAIADVTRSGGARSDGARLDGARPDAGGPTLLVPASYQKSVAAIVAECAKALEAIHAAGIVHRDIKPGNLLLTAGGHPILLDFGLAGLIDSTRSPLTSGLFGTLEYLAPEQVATRRSGTDRRTDIYQLGALLFELLTLERPWQQEEQDQKAQAIATKEPLSPRQIDPKIAFELDRVCARAMARDPADRYPDASALRQDLARYLDGRDLPVAASAGAPLAMRGRYVARRRLVPMLVGAVVVLFVVLGAALVLWPRGERATFFEAVLARREKGDHAAVVLQSDGVRFVCALLIRRAEDGTIKQIAAARLRAPGRPASDGSGSGSGAGAGAGSAAAAASLAGAEGSLVLPLTAGSHEIEVVNAPPSIGPNESLLIRPSAERDPVLERTLDDLDNAAKRRGEMLPVDIALRYLDPSKVARGPEAASVAGVAALREALQSAPAAARTQSEAGGVRAPAR